MLFVFVLDHSTNKSVLVWLVIAKIANKIILSVGERCEGVQFFIQFLGVQFKNFVKNFFEIPRHISTGTFGCFTKYIFAIFAQLCPTLRVIWFAEFGTTLCHVTGTTTNQKQSKTTIFLQKEEETQLSFLKNIESDVPKTGVYHNNIWSAQLGELRVWRYQPLVWA